MLNTKHLCFEMWSSNNSCVIYVPSIESLMRLRVISIYCDCEWGSYDKLQVCTWTNPPSFIVWLIETNKNAVDTTWNNTRLTNRNTDRNTGVRWIKGCKTVGNRKSELKEERKGRKLEDKRKVNEREKTTVKKSSSILENREWLPPCSINSWVVLCIP